MQCIIPTAPNILVAREPLPVFRRETRRFIQNNWWVFLLFGLGLFTVAINHSGNLGEISSVFVFHCLADLFIMTMVAEYASGNFRSGTLYQIAAKVIFIGITLHGGLAHGTWYYMSAEVLYFLAAFKNYRKDVQGRETPWLNGWTTTLVGIGVFLGFFLPYGILAAPSQFIQAVGIFLFAVALSITNNERLRYRVSLLAMSGMVVGSGWECYRTFAEGAVAGLAFSYFLLPLTVLVFYLKLWGQYHTGSEKNE